MIEVGETWKPVPRYEGWYEVSDLGNIRRSCPGPGTKIGKPVKPINRGHGYVSVMLSKNANKEVIQVHRIVVETFIGSIPPEKQVNHKNGRKADNRLENLEIVTPSENQYHASANGLFHPSRGEHRPMAKLTDDAVRQIRHLAQTTNMFQYEIASLFGVAPCCVGEILRGKRWKHVV